MASSVSPTEAHSHPISQLAMQGLNLRAGEITHKINKLTAQIQSKNPLFRLLSKIGLTYDARIKNALVKEHKELDKMMAILKTLNPKSLPSPQKNPSDDLANLYKQKHALQKDFSLAIKLDSLAKAGLIKGNDTDAKIIRQMDELEALANGLHLCINQPILSELDNKTLVDFIATNETTNFTGMDKPLIASKLHQKLQESLKAPIPTSVACTTLRQHKKEPLPASALQDPTVVRWYERIPDFKAALSTLGRRNLSEILLDGNRLKDTQAEQSLYQGCCRVALVATQLEDKIVAKWPSANKAEVEQLVADTLTLMAIDYNPASTLMFLGGIFARLANNTIFTGGEPIPNDYTLLLGHGDQPSCAITFTTNFKRVDTEQTYNVTTTLSRAVQDTSFTGAVALKIID